tara:strand:- start:275 stop:757 length:483 start_codon:yes stop_codon:yes gene_type:complete
MDKIYCLTNKMNGHQYIGFTTRNINDRLAEHFAPSSYKSGNPIHRAIKKYGKENFKVEILYSGDDALEKENVFISELSPHYNVTPGGNVPPNQTGKKWKLSEETKQKMRKPKGKRTKEHTEKIAEKLRGRPAWNSGKTGVYSEETRRKMSIAAKNRKRKK